MLQCHNLLWDFGSQVQWTYAPSPSAVLSSFSRISNVEVVKCIESERCGNSSVIGKLCSVVDRYETGSLPHLKVAKPSQVSQVGWSPSRRLGVFKEWFLKLKLSKRDRVQLDPCVENIKKTVRRVQGNNSAHSKLGQKELIYRNFQEMLKRVSRKAQKPWKSVLCWTVLPILDRWGTCQHSSLKQVHPCNEPLRQIGPRFGQCSNMQGIAVLRKLCCPVVHPFVSFNGGPKLLSFVVPLKTLGLLGLKARLWDPWWWLHLESVGNSDSTEVTIKQHPDKCLKKNMVSICWSLKTVDIHIGV